MSFAGTYTALVTPFRDGAFDSEAFRNLIETQVAGGVDGIVPVGTTGESPTLTYEEHTEVIRVAIEAAKSRCRVIAGTGSNATAEAVSLTKEAESLGADAALLVAPYYNKPSQEGCFRHFEAIGKAVPLPTIVYNVPGRTNVDLQV
ncbi:MAG: dihydrodipicolinate synthase family protein, partial [Terrimicrobiaceae bacterium]